MEGKSQSQVPFTGVPTTPSVDPELVDSRAGMADVRDYPRREDAEVPGPLGVIDLLLEKQNKCEAYYTRGRHSNVDCFYLAQNYFKLPRQTIRENANFICLFR